MAAVDVRTMVGSPETRREIKIIHPFFGKPAKVPPTTDPAQASPNVPEPSSSVDTNISAIIPSKHVDLSIPKAPAPVAITPDVPSTSPLPQAADSIGGDDNESRRKRRRTTPIRTEDEKASFNKFPGSSQDTTLEFTPVKARVSSRVEDEPLVNAVPHAPLRGEPNPSPPNTQLGHPVSHPEPASKLEKTTHEQPHAQQEHTLPLAEPTSKSEQITTTADTMEPQKPKKMLRFNTKSGTIGSPPAKKLPRVAAKKAAEKETVKAKSAAADSGEAQQEPPKKSGRSRKKRKPMPITLSYGDDEERRMRVGFAIQAILEGKERVKIPPIPAKGAVSKKRARKATNPPKAVNDVSNQQAETKAIENNTATVPSIVDHKPKPPPKPAHPFFLGKAAIKPIAKTDDSAAPNVSSNTSSRQTTPPRKSSTKTMVTPKKMARTGPQGTHISNAGNAFSAFSTAPKLQKVPGSLEAAWPWQGMTHVRGRLESVPMPSFDYAALPLHKLGMRKSKYAATIPAPGEDILENLIAKLNLDAVKKEMDEVDTNYHLPADKHLRVPNRHFESGVKLQRRVGPQIKASLSERAEIDDSEDELAKQNPGLFPHFAISNLYRKIPHSLSAYDQGDSDTQTWAQKYAPACAKEVLQCGPDAQILKSWLQTLTVDAVDNGTGKKDAPATKKSKKDEAPKRKRKSKKLDGFVVSDDDEDNEMEEVSQFEDSPPGSQGGLKTVVRRGDAMAKGSKEPTKLMNAVVVSGPSGCGKTAAIYAVAKELDFEIFEINSSTRRSGKDILEKVGDMTKNHLVQHKRQSSADADDDLRHVSDALDADLKSGRQGTMMSFFSKTPAPKAPKETNSEPRPTKPTKQEKADAPKPRVQQKQSLILLEEVDVLYDEDKEFWKTILDLAQSSKRPIIMTCNDETLVPKQALPLHAIIRFAPPPTEMAVDYLLLVAANEGHVLHRNSVTQLYEVHHHDLRASLTDLQFWCQFGVGDRKGGLDWFVPRWPKGQDLDAHGRKVRVVSEGTYRTGMGMLGHDYLCSPNNIVNAEDEMLKEAWDGWELDAGDWHDSLKLDHWSGKAKVPAEKLMQALEAYEDFTDAMSSADLCSHGWYGTGNQSALDTSSPKTFPKALEDNVLGTHFLKADIVQHQSTLERDISISIKCLARDAAQKHAAQFPNAASTAFEPITETQVDRFIVASLNKEPEGIIRYDFGTAFDPIASVDSYLEQSSSYLQASVIDRTTRIIALDVAPYIRGIVAYDAKLAEERKKLSCLLSEGGRPGRKKMRTTRAAMSALEGGERKSTRREKWFGDKANSILVKRTGGAAWEQAADQEMLVRRQKAEREREEAGVKIKRPEAEPSS